MSGHLRRPWASIPVPPSPASLATVCDLLDVHRTSWDAEFPCVLHCWWSLSVWLGNLKLWLLNERNRAITMSLFLSHKAQLSVWEELSNIFSEELQGQYSSCLYWPSPFPVLYPVPCGHEHRDDCIYPLFPLGTPSVEQREVVVYLLLNYQRQILFWKSTGLHPPTGLFQWLSTSGFHSGMSS